LTHPDIVIFESIEDTYNLLIASITVKTVVVFMYVNRGIKTNTHVRAQRDRK